MLVALTVVSVALVVTVAGFVSLLRSVQHAAARERQILLDRLCHLAGRNWTVPPADEWRPPAGDEPLVRMFTATPEQQPL